MKHILNRLVNHETISTIEAKQVLIKISKGDFIKPESLKNEEFDCAKRKANFQNTSQNVDFDEF